LRRDPLRGDRQGKQVIAERQLRQPGRRLIHQAVGEFQNTQGFAAEIAAAGA
jgi:hypothetical protein